MKESSVTLLLLAAVTYTFAQFVPEDYIAEDAPSFPIDVSLPFEARWNSFPWYLCEKLQDFEPTFQSFYIMNLFRTLDKYHQAEDIVLQFLNTPANKDFKSELFGLARKCQVREGYLAMYNMMYEFGQLAHCSAVAFTSHFESFLYSNLDYNFHEYFSETVFHAQYYQGSVKLYEARQLFGFVGYVTGTNGQISVTLNARYWKLDLDEFLETLKRGNLTPTVYGFRKAIETSHSLEEFKEKLQKTQELAPAYYTIVDIHSNKACVITRGLNQTENSECLDETKWYLVQTNADRYMISDTRRKAAETRLESFDKLDTNLGSKILTQILYSKPNFNIFKDYHD